MSRVKTLRTESRQERASRTRARILEAAYRLFCERGWEASTMQAVADEAGVAVQTVYFTFHTKAQLLGAVEEQTVLGGTPRSEFFENWRTVLAQETDPRRLITIFVDTDTTVKRRITPLVAGLGRLLPSDTPTKARRDHGRDRFFVSLIDRLQQLQALRAELTPDRALDILTVLNGQSTFSELTVARGWAEDDWKQWLVQVLTEQLVGRGSPSRSTRALRK